MNKQQQMMQIRLKKLGLLIYDARNSAHRSILESADAIGVSVDDYQAFEKGNKALSLPQLETLAFYLDIPLEHFWGAESLSTRKKPENIQQKEQFSKIRNRVIGASLRAARIKFNQSQQELSLVTSISEDMISQYEMGASPIPLPELEILSNALKLRIEDLIDQRGPIGKWRSEKNEIDHFLAIEPEVRQFICTPVNFPYITLAKRLSQMSVEKLRSIAETILEITF
jgi:transcriptional regulator with XRE-family HTH domain